MGVAPFPPTHASFRALAATLKYAGYASSAIYMSVYRTRCERQGYCLDQSLLRAQRDYVKSCERGMGGPARPRALPKEELWRLPAGRDAWHLGGPVDPRAAMMVGCWFLCREVELSTSRARTKEFSEGEGAWK